MATSTAEAEYMAMSTCAKESQWLVRLLRDMGAGEYLGRFPYQGQLRENEKFRSYYVNMKGDNQAALSLAKDPQIHDRSKHIDIHYHNIRDLIQRNRIHVEYVCTEDMVADGLTKPLPREGFQRFVSQLGLEKSRHNG